MNKSYDEEIIQRYRASDPLVNCRNITFQVTDDCCLKCSYCYQGHKGHAMMSNKIAEKGIDLLFKLYDQNDENAVINKHTKGIILDFIGGEPFMNVETMSHTIDYFINKCLKLDHIWLTSFRVSISTNGILYFEPAVQEFLRKYNSFISMTITLDGPKAAHDRCRVDYNGNGSFDRAFSAWLDWKNKNPADFGSTKVTIAPENLNQMESIFDFFIANGSKHIHANPIFEHLWTTEEAAQYYQILRKLANRLLLDKSVSSSLFEESKGLPLPDTDTANWCGGLGKMLAFDPYGNAYPCLRYMASSLKPEHPPIIIGNIDGIYNTPKYQAIYDDMTSITRQSQSTQECLECPVASGCSWCSAANYDQFGTYHKRSMNICWMHRAEALANVYYWNKYYIFNKIDENRELLLPKDIALQIISEKDYKELKLLSSI